MSRYSPTERIGVNAVEQLALKELGWIFREQPISDMGIDAHLEAVDGGKPTGKLLGVQIKTGASHFTDAGDSLTYYGTLTHLNYWLSHSLPVILVAHLPESGSTYWVRVTSSTAERTKKAWRISIPKAQALDMASLEGLSKALEGSEREIRSRNLFLHIENMRYLNQGGRLVIYKEEWHNKSLGRGALNLIQVNSGGTEETLKKGFYWYTGYDTKSLVEEVYPWASVSIDEQYYEDNFCDSFYSVYTDSYIETHDIYPYEVISGEISLYRLELKLNDLGRSFMEVFAYLEDET